MKLNLVLQALQKHNVEIQVDRLDEHGNRVLIFGARLPMMPYGERYEYVTLVLAPDQDEICIEERDVIRRRLCHLTTNIFGDDPDFEGFDEADEEENGSHLHMIVPKPEDQ